jgi:glycine cleavage system regulatory protein
MTVIGRDRPGLVESVASLVTDHGGNWLESRMSRLGGHFAGILRVEVPEQNQRRLVTALEGLATHGLTVVVHSGESKSDAPVQRLSILEIVGQDRPGIVRQISQALAAFGVNVEELETECSSAAMSGETLFKARARLSLPETCDASEVRRKLEKIAGDLIVDISFLELPADQPAAAH